MSPANERPSQGGGHPARGNGARPPGFLVRAAPAVLPWAASGLYATCRLRILNRVIRDDSLRSGRPFVAVIWHQFMLLGLRFLPRRKMAVMASRSRDGDYTTRILRRFGHRVVRGSSSAGGAEALRELVRVVRQGYGGLMVADGPKGPAREAKLGCVLLARDAEAPLLPIGCAVSSALYLRNWDRTAIPYPFARIVIAYGSPIHVPASSSREECERVRVRLHAAMEELEAQSRRVAEA